MQNKLAVFVFIRHPIFHHNKPSRESIICRQAETWWAKRALIMLKFLLKNGQEDLFKSWRVNKVTS